MIDESNLSKATKKEYTFRVGLFYRFSGIKNDKDLLDCPSTELQNHLVAYTRHLVKRVNKSDLSANTVPKMFRGIKWLLNSNYREHDIHWKPLEALFPKSVKRSGYKAWTTEQIKSMIDTTHNLRNKAIIHFQASTGGRIGVHDHPLLMKHLTIMDWNGHGCYAVLFYADVDETVEEKDIRDKQDDVQGGDSYYSFLTPEATDALDRYFEERKRKGESFNDDTPIFLKEYRQKPDSVEQLTDVNIISVLFRLIKDSTEITRVKKGRRYDVEITHGFRKRCNTILKLESDVNSNVAEKILGHKNGLDGVYLAPTRKECFDEFCKGIIQLTISDNQRQKIEIKKLETEKTELDKMKKQIKHLTEQNEITNDIISQLFKRADKDDLREIFDDPTIK